MKLFPEEIAHQSHLFQQFLETDFENKLFQATMNNSYQIYNPLVVNNFAYSMRELSRHILSRLSPDANVLSCDYFEGYIPPGSDGKRPTRRELIRYAIQGGLEINFVKDELNIDVETSIGEILESIKDLNKYTHINLESFDIGLDKSLSIILETLKQFVYLFQSIEDVHQELCSHLRNEIEDEVIDHTIRDTIVAIDSISTHHSIEEVDINEIRIKEISHNAVIFDVKGVLCVSHQYGSNSDLRRDDGLLIDKSYHFIANPEASILDLNYVSLEEADFFVETH
jgi:hypothetical protein